MGIKFLCPNGHKLNVKSFLAGKKAICPKCGARVVVPAEDQPTGDAEGPQPATRALGSAEPAAESPMEASLVDDALASLDASQSIALAEAPPEAPAGVEQADALLEAPDAVWYVRAASGGQYGPASAEIMRTWLADGRIAANSLVWRAPWPEWRSADRVFAGLVSASTAAAAPADNGAPPASLPLGHAVQSVESGPPPLGAGPSMTPLAHAVRKRRRKNDISLVASAVLVGVSLILIIVLVLVFRAQSGGSDEKTEDLPAAGEETVEPVNL